MENSTPLLLLLFFWIVIGIPLSVAKKAANQKKSARPAAQKTVPAENRPAAPKQAPLKQAPPERLTTLTSSLYEPDHDDSVFTGSLGPVMSEGYDPCHDEQMRNMEPVCQPGRETPVPKEVSALPFGWTGSDIVRGIVMSEILNRKH